MEHVQNVRRVFDDKDLQTSQAHRNTSQCARMIDTSETEASCEGNSSPILGFRRAALSLPLVIRPEEAPASQKIQADAWAVLPTSSSAMPALSAGTCPSSNVKAV
jgi:hypothetical protein